MATIEGSGASADQDDKKAEETKHQSPFNGGK
jgi:hypothetical protein